eukprot:283701-Amphidinium_carterae.1
MFCALVHMLSTVAWSAHCGGGEGGRAVGEPPSSTPVHGTASRKLLQAEESDMFFSVFGSGLTRAVLRKEQQNQLGALQPAALQLEKGPWPDAAPSLQLQPPPKL